jgi:hypothetical protein
VTILVDMTTVLPPSLDPEIVKGVPSTCLGVWPMVREDSVHGQTTDESKARGRKTPHIPRWVQIANPKHSIQQLELMQETNP